ncbi:hypothetical protein Goklo_012584 [Gossypium klotzschianum]|uniref:Myb/SANT-like domain-containing protein n=1 Tax=Gossypium klotzschianum TaxID=34286 RepID=A0A7J8VCT6_9ROSI|nr:hypothetical protein [Gossypium klotzschianum]
MLEPLMQIRDSRKSFITCSVEKDNSGFGWDEHRQLVIAEDVSHKKGQSIQTSQFPLL